MKNRKAQLGEQIMSFPFIFMLLIIGLGIAAGIYMFFGSGYDFRKVDADILNYKIRNCLSNKSINFDQEQTALEEEFFTTCALNQEVIKENFIILIEQNNNVKIGTKSDETTCSLSEKNPEYPICTTTYLDNFKIVTGSKQQAQRQIT